mmetsp:Transcript_4892/g.11165  ORF Transcript_4892/g.11165 Transcript_4892/m.11165 type:complete len:130 (-) Transcript_4892:735-1124(-)
MSWEMPLELEESINGYYEHRVCLLRLVIQWVLRNIMMWIDLRSRRLFVESVLRSRVARPTFASTALSNSANITAQSATSGCPTKNAPTTAPTAVSAASAAEKTFGTAKTAECASIVNYSTPIIAKWENT